MRLIVCYICLIITNETTGLMHSNNTTRAKTDNFQFNKKKKEEFRIAEANTKSYRHSEILYLCNNKSLFIHKIVSIWFFLSFISFERTFILHNHTVQTVFRNEKKYYERLVEKSVESLCLFPYHLADIITKGLRVTPFIYYVDVLCDLLKKDRSYDTLPNFTAADCA